MKNLISTLTLTALSLSTLACATAPALPGSLAGSPSDPAPLSEVLRVDEALFDITEVTDPEAARANLEAARTAAAAEATVMNRVRLGIAYHEAALNLLPLGETGHVAHAVEILSDPELHVALTPALETYVFSYLASSRALWAADGGPLSGVGASFEIFERVIEQHGETASIAYFLRGSVAESLPWFFFKRRVARDDFETILALAEGSPGYASQRTLSFTHFGLGRLLVKKDAVKALEHLRQATALDTDGSGAAELAAPLLAELQG